MLASGVIGGGLQDTTVADLRHFGGAGQFETLKVSESYVAHSKLLLRRPYKLWSSCDAAIVIDCMHVRRSLRNVYYGWIAPR